MDISDYIVKGVVLLFLPALIMCLGFVVVSPYLMYQAYMHPSPAYELNKSEFSCTREHLRIVGKVMVSTCDRYEQNGYVGV